MVWGFKILSFKWGQKKSKLDVGGQWYRLFSQIPRGTLDVFMSVLLETQRPLIAHSGPSAPLVWSLCARSGRCKYHGFNRWGADQR